MGGLSWDYGDTALTIMNPAYGLYRLFGGKSPTSGGSDGPSEHWNQVTLTETDKGQTYRDAQASLAPSEQRRQQALQALRAMRQAPAQSYTPISVSVPSFTIGEDF